MTYAAIRARPLLIRSSSPMLLSALTCSLTHSLQIEQFRNLIRGNGPRLRTQTDQRRKMTNVPMQFSEQNKSGWSIARWVDQERTSLPLLRRELSGLDDSADLWPEWLSLIDLHRDGADLIDGNASESLDLGFVFVGERVGEVEYE